MIISMVSVPQNSAIGLPVTYNHENQVVFQGQEGEENFTGMNELKVSASRLPQLSKALKSPHNDLVHIKKMIPDL